MILFSFFWGERCEAKIGWKFSQEWQMKGPWVSAALRISQLFITAIATTVKKAFGNVPSAKSPDYFFHFLLVAKSCFCPVSCFWYCFLC